MKRVKKNVYYCDFCKKKGLSKYHIKKHEKHCTGNLDRECRMCEEKYDYREIAKKYEAQAKEAYDYMCSNKLDDNPSCKMEEITQIIIDEVEYCPACAWTLLKQLSSFVNCSVCFFEYNFIDRSKDWFEERKDDTPIF